MPTKKTKRVTASSETQLRSPSEEQWVFRKRHVSTKGASARASWIIRVGYPPEVEDCLQFCADGYEADMFACEDLEGDARAKCISAARKAYRACRKNCLGNRAA